MLCEKDVKEIREHLERAQNPVFFFDNDQDGLCSFLILQRFLERGKGVAIKSFPALDENYARKVDELGADYVFILDKPVVSEEFFAKVKEKNIPIVWVDHHLIDCFVPDYVHYYNPCKEFKTCEPVSALCYQVTQNKKDLWLAVIGCIADYFLPEFYEDFLKDYSELGKKTQDPFDVLYDSKIGEIAELLSNGLKDTTTNVVKMLKFLVQVTSPYDVLEESAKNYTLHRRSKYIKEKYTRILEKAKAVAQRSGNMIFFTYAGDLSVSGEISNHLKYLYPGKTIVVVYLKGPRANLSLRGEYIRDVFLKAIEGIAGATGGGHADAVGGQMQTDDVDTFRKRLEKELGK